MEGTKLGGCCGGHLGCGGAVEGTAFIEFKEGEGGAATKQGVMEDAAGVLGAVEGTILVGPFCGRGGLLCCEQGGHLKAL